MSYKRLNFFCELKMSNLNDYNYITEDNVKLILKNHFGDTSGYILKDYSLHSASKNMLGLTADHWRLKVSIEKEDEKTEILSFFIKALPRSNEGKAAMVTDMKLFDKEMMFYSEMQRELSVKDIKPWSATFVVCLENDIVLDDLNLREYKPRNIFKTFDEAHIFEALNTLVRFHGSCIILEEKKSRELNTSYRLHEHYQKYMSGGGYDITDPWYIQCMNCTLEMIKRYSKYGRDANTFRRIEEQWGRIWNTALELCNVSPKYRNVICHRDLWNNNILFHYNESNHPDDCLLVDFQAITTQPITGDIMMLLYCNLDAEFRENNINTFLNYYYKKLKLLLDNHNISINDVISWDMFIESAKEQRLWGAVVSACLLPSLWINEEITMKNFSDTDKFSKIMTKDKASFVGEMFETNEDYAAKILPMYDEIVERYCLDMNKETITK